MPKRGAPLTRFLACLLLGCSLGFVAASFTPLWRVERPTDHLGEIGLGNFWEFLGDLPRALENLGVEQTPMNALTILPTVYFWENIRTTLLVLAAGTCLGCAA